jgi:hypothetical protein
MAGSLPDDVRIPGRVVGVDPSQRMTKTGAQKNSGKPGYLWGVAEW